jgi:hypothetical protein
VAAISRLQLAAFAIVEDAWIEDIFYAMEKAHDKYSNNGVRVTSGHFGCAYTGVTGWARSNREHYSDSRDPCGRPADTDGQD